jgi:hypothetical protein
MLNLIHLNYLAKRIVKTMINIHTNLGINIKNMAIERGIYVHMNNTHLNLISVKLHILYGAPGRINLGTGNL